MRGFTLAVIASLLAARAQAVVIYATSYEGQRIVKCDTSTNTVTTINDVSMTYHNPDSLLFDSAGNIVYTAHLNGSVQYFNTTTLTDTTLANNFTNPADLTLDPSGTTVLVSDYNAPGIKRVPLAGGPGVMLPGTSTEIYNGTAYARGHLFGNANFNHVEELDPTTGNVLNSSITNTSWDLDGMCFDPVTNHLWVSDLNNGVLMEFAPGSLNFVVHSLPTLSGSSLLPDGLVSDGAGKLYWASRKDFNIYEYDISTGVSTPLINVFGLDDLAPVAGSGALPEPGTMALIAVGGIVLSRRSRK